MKTLTNILLDLKRFKLTMSSTSGKTKAEIVTVLALAVATVEE